MRYSLTLAALLLFCLPLHAGDVTIVIDGKEYRLEGTLTAVPIEDDDEEPPPDNGDDEEPPNGDNGEDSPPPDPIAEGIPLPITIIDHHDATVVGEWELSTRSPGFYGSDYLVATGDGSVTWEVDLPHDGRYWIDMSWPRHRHHANEVPVTIENAGAIHQLTVDQTIYNVPWHFLGSFTAKAGPLTITLSADAAGIVNADAVRVRSTQHSEPLPYEFIYNDPNAIIVENGETLEVDGTLEFSTLLVRPHGHLINLPGSELVVVGELDRRNPDDPFQHTQGIIVEGTWTANGAPKTSWLRAENDVEAGGITLMLEREPEGWEVGDRLIIPATHQRQFEDESLSEIVELERIDGTTITFTPVEHDHFGAIFGFDEFMPHVGNLTRDIVVRAADPDHPGHTMSLAGSTTKLEHVEFVHMGRTTSDLLNPTVTSGMSRLTNTPGDHSEIYHYGTNEPGRYPVHAHRGRQAVTFVIDGCSFAHSLKWAIAVHSTTGARVLNNVIWDTQGAAIMCEEGDEIDVHIIGNFAVKGTEGGPGSNSGTRRFGFTMDNGEESRDHLNHTIDSGWDASIIWVRNVPTGIIRGNVGADMNGAGYVWGGYYGGRNLDGEPAAFQDNEVYNSRWALYSAHSRTNPIRRRYIDGLRSWHNNQGTHLYWAERWTFRNCWWLADFRAAGRGVMLHGKSYRNVGHELINCRIEGYRIGVKVPWNIQDEWQEPGDQQFLIQDTVLRNWVDISVPLARSDQKVIIDGIDFVGSDVPRPLDHRGSIDDSYPDERTNIWMNHNRINKAGDTTPIDVLWLDEGVTVHYLPHDGYEPPCDGEMDGVIGFVCPEEE